MAVRIMVVDDSTTVQKVIKLILAPLGYEVLCFSSGKKALEEIKKNPPALIFADAVMPDLNGIELGAQSKVPLVLMHSTFDEITKDDLKKSRAKAKLVKPFDDQQIIEYVQEILKADNIDEYDDYNEDTAVTEMDEFIKISDDEEIEQLGIPDPEEKEFITMPTMSEEELSEHEAKKLLEEFNLEEKPDGTIEFKSSDVKTPPEFNVPPLPEKKGLEPEKDMGLWSSDFEIKDDEIASDLELWEQEDIIVPEMQSKSKVEVLNKDEVQKMIKELLPDMVEKIVREEIAKIIGK